MPPKSPAAKRGSGRPKKAAGAGDHGNPRQLLVDRNFFVPRSLKKQKLADDNGNERSEKVAQTLQIAQEAVEPSASSDAPTKFEEDSASTKEQETSVSQDPHKNDLVQGAPPATPQATVKATSSLKTAAVAVSKAGEAESSKNKRTSSEAASAHASGSKAARKQGSALQIDGVEDQPVVVDNKTAEKAAELCSQFDGLRVLSAPEIVELDYIASLSAGAFTQSAQGSKPEKGRFGWVIDPERFPAKAPAVTTKAQAIEAGLNVMEQLIKGNDKIADRLQDFREIKNTLAQIAERSASPHLQHIIDDCARGTATPWTAQELTNIVQSKSESSMEEARPPRSLVYMLVIFEQVLDGTHAQVPKYFYIGMSTDAERRLDDHTRDMRWDGFSTIWKTRATKECADFCMLPLFELEEDDIGTYSFATILRWLEMLAATLTGAVAMTNNGLKLRARNGFGMMGNVINVNMMPCLGTSNLEQERWTLLQLNLTLKERQSALISILIDAQLLKDALNSAEGDEAAKIRAELAAKQIRLSEASQAYEAEKKRIVCSGLKLPVRAEMVTTADGPKLRWAAILWSAVMVFDEEELIDLSEQGCAKKVGKDLFIVKVRVTEGVASVLDYFYICPPNLRLYSAGIKFEAMSLSSASNYCQALRQRRHNVTTAGTIPRLMGLVISSLSEESQARREQLLPRRRYTAAEIGDNKWAKLLNFEIPIVYVFNHADMGGDVQLKLTSFGVDGGNAAMRVNVDDNPDLAELPEAWLGVNLEERNNGEVFFGYNKVGDWTVGSLPFRFEKYTAAGGRTPLIFECTNSSWPEALLRVSVAIAEHLNLQMVPDPATDRVPGPNTRIPHGEPTWHSLQRRVFQNATKKRINVTQSLAVKITPNFKPKVPQEADHAIWKLKSRSMVFCLPPLLVREFGLAVDIRVNCFVDYLGKENSRDWRLLIESPDGSAWGQVRLNDTQREVIQLWNTLWARAR